MQARTEKQDYEHKQGQHELTVYHTKGANKVTQGTGSWLPDEVQNRRHFVTGTHTLFEDRKEASNEF